MRHLRLLILMLLPAVFLTLGACQTIPRPVFDAADLAAASPPWRYDFRTEGERARFVRETINAQLLDVVDQATNPWGIKVTRIEIRDIQPPRDLIDSMARQMKAERERRAVILEAEGHRQSAILRAEGEKQAAILEAEGEREAAFREAEARERLAEAEAKATEMVSNAIAQGDVQAINYFVAQKYTEAIAKLAAADNQRVILMPLESASLIGALGGISEIAREAFDKPKPPSIRPGG